MTRTSDRDHATFFETEGTFGYGSIMSTGVSGDGENSQSRELTQTWKSLTRSMDIPATMYRRIVFFYIVILGFYFAWKIMHKNEDAIWLWGISVVCELWVAFSWLLTQLPKLFPINRVVNLTVLKEKFESISSENPTGKSDLPGIDVFVSIANSKKEPTALEIANTILSVLAVDYPTEKLCSYVSDDAGNILTFEAMVEAASFAKLWIPFCRKHDIGCRNPEIYFNSTQDPYINQRRHTNFVNDRRRLKREYDNFEDRINGLSGAIKRRSDVYYESEVKNAMEVAPESIENIAKATWMSNGVHWPGAWENPSLAHSYDHHSGMIQVILKSPSDEPLFGNYEEAASLDFTGVDMRLPMLVYVSREKHPEYEHHKKAGTLNALLRASAVMSNGPFILDLDCNQYIYNSQFLREGICFMMDWDGDQEDQLCYVQFPQSFDPSDCHVGVNMRALDGLQGPVYVGTGCLFRRIALYGFDPPGSKEHHAGCCSCCFPQKRKSQTAMASEETHALHLGDYMTEEMAMSTFPQKFGNSSFLIDSIPAAELQGRPLADHPAIKYGRQPGILTAPREFLDASAVSKALSVISSGYEDKTEWGHCIGWIYGSESEDVVTGYRMHNRGWKSVYCVTKPDAFRRTAPMNLTDRLHQRFQQATGSVEIFFSRNNALLASSRMKILQRVAYFNVGIYPFTSVFLVAYCFLPVLSLFAGQLFVQILNGTFLMYLLIITLTRCMLSILETKWDGITFKELWRNEQFWLIEGTGAHLAAMVQGLLKVIAGIELTRRFTLNLFPPDHKLTPLVIPPITIMVLNLIAIAVGIGRAIYRTLPIPQWTDLLASVCFSFWVLAHLYPVTKELMGQRKIPTIIIVWCGLLSITISLVWVSISQPSSMIGGSFTFP